MKRPPKAVLRVRVTKSETEPGLSLYYVEDPKGTEYAVFGAKTPEAHNAVRRRIVDILVDLGAIIWHNET